MFEKLKKLVACQCNDLWPAGAGVDPGFVPELFTAVFFVLEAYQSSRVVAKLECVCFCKAQA